MNERLFLPDPRRIRRRGVAKEGMAIAPQGLGVLVLLSGKGAVLGRAARSEACQPHRHRSPQSRE